MTGILQDEAPLKGRADPKKAGEYGFDYQMSLEGSLLGLWLGSYYMCVFSSLWTQIMISET